MSREERVVFAENIEHFIDQVIEAATEGFVRVPTGELAFAVETNYWKMTMFRESVETEEPQAPDVVEKPATKRTK